MATPTEGNGQRRPRPPSAGKSKAAAGAGRRDPDAPPLAPDTVAVSAGRGRGDPGAPITPPVTLAATYHAEGPIAYGRDGNPTWEALEDVLGALEGGTAVSFSSGLAAISAVIEALPAGAVVVGPGDAYNGTRRLLSDLASRGRLTVRLVDLTDAAATLAACEDAALLWLESPTNPLMAIADLAGLSAGAHERGVGTVAVDNTFATPMLQRPLDLGADVVVHSVTKLLAGHSDVVLGAAVARDEALVESLRLRRGLHGAIPGPLEAYLALRGVRTLGVRLERAQATAAELARRLAGHGAVSVVRYPGLATHPGHEIAARQMRGFGTILSFELHGGADVADAVCGAVKLCMHATSLGGVETLIERRNRWAGEDNTPAGLLRLSVGIENVEDLWADLDHALGAATSVRRRR